MMQCRQRPCAQPLHQLGRDLDIRTVRYLQRNLRYLQGLPEINNGLLDPLYGIFKQPRIDMGGADRRCNTVLNRQARHDKRRI